jgi:ATP-dependent Lon protease
MPPKKSTDGKNDVQTDPSSSNDAAATTVVRRSSRLKKRRKGGVGGGGGSAHRKKTGSGGGKGSGGSSGAISEDDFEDDSDVVVDSDDDGDDEILQCLKTPPRGSRRARSRSPTRDNVAFEEYLMDEKFYYRTLDRRGRRRIADIENRVWAINEVAVPLRFRVLNSEVDERVKAVAIKKVESLSSMDGTAYHKVMQWVDGLCSLPLGKFQRLPVQPDAPQADVAAFLTSLRESLDARVYGHSDAKGHVVRLIAQWITNPGARGLVLGVHGHPGLGKTELCKAVCEVLGLPFAFVPLGGANDGAYLDGHSYTYEGATWGKIADVLMKNRVMNPVLFFDELDKVSESRRGEEIVNLLIHLTDATQNDRFNDKFFVDIELDLSRCLVIFSYNDESRISPILRDRMVRIHTEGYSLKDKVRIAKDHLLPGILSQFSMPPGSVRLGDAEIARVVETVEEEQGVRNLKRALHDIVSCINFDRLMGKLPAAGDDPRARGHVTLSQVDAYVKSGRRDAPGSAAMRDSTRLAMYL